MAISGKHLIIYVSSRRRSKVFMPMNFNLILFFIGILLFPVGALAQMVKVTGNNVALTYINIDCSSVNEVGMLVTGTGFIGQQLSAQNCVAGGFQFNESATLKNSLAISDGADITIATGKTVTGTYNLFGDVNTLGAKYSDIGNTTFWSSTYDNRLDNGGVIIGLHSGRIVLGGDATGNTKLYKCRSSRIGVVDIGSDEQRCLRDSDGLGSLIPRYGTVD
jgi:hypothetical protein